MSAGAVHMAAGKITADTAGQTSTGEVAPQPASVIVGLEPTVLSNLFAGGIHPEAALVAPVSHDVERATDSLRGPHGGLSPLRTGILANGPAGGSAAVAEVTRATTASAQRAASWSRRQLDRLRGKPNA